MIDSTETSPTQRLRRAQACCYLKNTWGIERSPSTLAKYAVSGSGPRYQLEGRTPLYPTFELDEWAKGRLSALKRSSSEKGAV